MWGYLACVDFVILEMREGSGYADSVHHYEFPARYLTVLDGMVPGETSAIVYEPRRNGGRAAFVAWATIVDSPVPLSSGMYGVSFGPVGLLSFDQPVPFATAGVPAEHRLRELERRHWGTALQGRAVRALPAANALEILAAGNPAIAAQTLSPVEASIRGTLVERDRELVSRLRRAAAFRDQVLREYDFTCAVTCLSCGPNPASRLNGLIDVAHIRPVAADGTDALGNGVSLTPTVHRLFDAGLFTAEYRGERLVALTSPQLLPDMLHSHRAVLRLEDGMPLTLPRNRAAWPSREFLEFHRESVFRSRAA